MNSPSYNIPDIIQRSGVLPPYIRCVTDYDLMKERYRIRLMSCGKRPRLDMTISLSSFELRRMNPEEQAQSIVRRVQSALEHLAMEMVRHVRFGN